MRAIEKQYGGIYDAVIQQKRRHGHRISLTTPGQPKLQSPEHSRTAHFHLIVDLCQHFFLTSLSHSIVWNTLQDLCNLKNARELIGRDILQGITGLCHIDRGAPTSPCILRGLAMYRGYIAHRARSDILLISEQISTYCRPYCVYINTQRISCISPILCAYHTIYENPASYCHHIDFTYI